MRRPEGFDEPARPEEPTPASERARAPRLPRRPARTERASTEASADATRATKPGRRSPAPRLRADAEIPDAAARPASARPPRRLRRASASRVAEAELRAAERARKRAEKRELRRFTRRVRRRRIAWAVGLGLVASLIGISLAAVFSPLLALRDIRVEGTTSLDPAQIVDAVDDQLGTPLALLDEGRLREQLGQFTLIRSYSTEILPPGTLIIHIVERSPVGAIVRGNAFDIVDAAGVVLASSAARPEGLPLIVVEAADPESPAFRSVAEVLLVLPASVRDQLDSIAATTRDDVTLTLAGSTQRVVWGSADDSEHKARVLAALVAIHGGSGPGTYDVSAPGTAVFNAG